MTNLTGRPVLQKTPKPAPAKEPKVRQAFVECPCTTGAPIAVLGVCKLCAGSKKLKLPFIRMAPGSGKNPKQTKITPEDREWSYKVRERDGWKCRWCGKQHTPRFSENAQRLVCPSLQAAHLFRRGHGNTRLDLLNGFAMCGGQHHSCCHTYVDSHRDEFLEWARKELGDAVFEDLQARSKVTKKRAARKLA